MISGPIFTVFKPVQLLNAELPMTLIEGRSICSRVGLPEKHPSPMFVIFWKLTVFRFGQLENTPDPYIIVTLEKIAFVSAVHPAKQLLFKYMTSGISISSNSLQP